MREELKDSGVTVSCLMPGATETEFFKRADLMDTSVGQAKKDDPADVVKVGYDAMMDGEGDVVSGWKNKLQAAVANVTPASVLAHQSMPKWPSQAPAKTSVQGLKNGPSCFETHAPLRACSCKRDTCRLDISFYCAGGLNLIESSRYGKSDNEVSEASARRPGSRLAATTLPASEGSSRTR